MNFVDSALGTTMNTAKYPIPEKLNVVLVLGTITSMVSCLIFLGTVQEKGVLFYSASILFCLLFMTNFFVGRYNFLIDGRDPKVFVKIRC
jgi:hypothetical protein